MRKMATVRKIDSLRPIVGADAIECAIVGGWTCVVKSLPRRSCVVKKYSKVEVSTKL